MNLANKITLVRTFLVPIFMLFVTPMPEWMANKSGLFHTISKYSLWIATAIFILAAITDKLDGQLVI
jgi:CDP-diacylglycerol---glycerol-3-phosphate 3-phosphatidyltransferase